MIVKTQIYVSPQRYFNHLCSVIIKDIEKHTGKAVKMKDFIDGYCYERPMVYKNRKTVVLITVGPLIQDRYFQLTYETANTKGQYYYDFSEEDGISYVTYYENNDYKKESAGTVIRRFNKKIRESSIKTRILKNIELTMMYIKNHEE